MTTLCDHSRALWPVPTTSSRGSDVGRSARRLPPARAGRASSERGVALVELALCITVILIILYGTVELAFMYRSGTAANTASRAGARLAAATYGDAPNKLTAGDQIRISVEEALRQRSSTDTPTILRIYQADATGNPISSTFSACATNCQRYSWIGGQFVYQSGDWTSPDVCGTTIDSIGVYVEMTHASMTGIVRINRTFGERTVMRLEPSPACTTG